MRLLAFVALISSPVLAQSISGLHADQWVTSRTFATFGVTKRTSSQDFPEGKVTIAGGDPALLAMHLSGVVFPRQFFGVGYGVRSDLVRARGGSDALDQQTVHGYATAVLRWQPTLLFGLEGHLGWWGGRAALIRPLAVPTAEFKPLTGPLAGLTLAFDVTPRLTVQLSARLEASLAVLVGFGASLGAQVRYGLIELGPFDLGLAATFEAHGGRWSGNDVKLVDDGAFRLGLGPSLVSRRPAPAKVIAPAVAPGLIGKVTRADGTPVVGATVTVAGRTATTDEAGAFTVDELEIGRAHV